MLQFNFSYLAFVWFAALLGWLVMTLIFLYHWRRYSLPDDRAVARARIIYLTLTATLLVGSGGVFLFFF